MLSPVHRSRQRAVWPGREREDRQSEIRTGVSTDGRCPPSPPSQRKASRLSRSEGLTPSHLMSGVVKLLES